MIAAASCAVCGHPVEVVLSAQRYPLLTSACSPRIAVPMLPLVVGFCAHCSHVQLAQQPTQEHLDLIYLGEYTSVVQQGVLAGADRLASDCKAFFDFATSCQLPPASRVLEIGCFEGTFLSLFRGCKLIGCEPNQMAKVAAERFGIEIVPRYFQAGDFAPGEMDVVVMRHLIEHVREPVAMLRECHTVLRREGLLLLETPNVEHLLQEHVIGNFYHQHLQYFSFHSLQVALEQTGFRVVGKATKDFRQYVLAAASSRTAAAVEPTPYAGLIRRQIEGYVRYVSELQAAIGEWVRHRGTRVAMYGASSVATGIVHLGRLPAHRLAYIVDSDPRKQGKVLPGTDRPVLAPDHLREDPVETVFIASDYFKDEIRDSLRRRFPGIVREYIVAHPSFAVRALEG